MCSNCRADQQALWAIGPPYPKLTIVGSGNFVELSKCAECGKLWLESMYEPFAAFRYAVKWPSTAAKFEALRDQDQSLTLSRWHEAEVRLQGATAEPATLAHIRAHYERSRGYVDLRPTGKRNTVHLQ